ncbi:iron-sulfur cluster assembly scaffold protein [Halobacterium litoreum]|nr:iron-sulfur cluster assembly scaffold protein [Halobacterium litoreum]UHH14849.1 iron-sulfur cluster assembly scaffold protein [Halobacterium litoreum]
MFEHHRDRTNAGGLEDATFRKHSAETSCGDEGEFHVDLAADGTIREIGFESQSCAVSTAVASMLADHLTGEPVDALADLDGTVEALLDGQFPDVRRDCVVGPEDVISEGATEHLESARSADD